MIVPRRGRNLFSSVKTINSGVNPISREGTPHPHFNLEPLLVGVIRLRLGRGLVILYQQPNRLFNTFTYVVDGGSWPVLGREFDYHHHHHHHHHQNEGLILVWR